MKKRVVGVLFAIAVVMVIFLINFSPKAGLKIEFINKDRKQAEQILKDAESMIVYRDRNATDKNIIIQSESDEVVKQIPRKLIKLANYNPEIILWKGGFPAVITLESGEKKTAKVSAYGDFFVIEGIPGYFQIDEQYIKEWEEVIGLQ